MGSICSCLCLENLEEYIHSDASMHGCCGCFRSLAQQLIHLCNVFVQREEVQAIPLVEQRINSSTSTMDNSTPETYHSPPRPLPCDDPRRPQAQHDGPVKRCDKLSHLHEETVALRRSNMELSTTRCVGSNSEVASKLCHSKLNCTSVEVQRGVTYSFASYEDEDEDVCPTCLEEYTPENPKIVTKCFHHFHLGCIYEWKERSELCPVCGKVMVFDETW